MKKCILSLLVAAGMSTSVFAGSPHVLSLGSATTAAGASFDSAATYDNNGTNDVDGWSFGVCHDNTKLTLTAATAGAATIGLNGGGALGFESIEMPADGYTVGVVIDFFGANKLAPGTGYELMVGTYTNDQAALESTTMDFCDSLGVPPVATVIVVGGASLVPLQNSGTVDTIEGPPPFAYNASSSSVDYDPTTGTAASDTSIDLSIVENPANPGYPNDTQGFSLDIGCDPTFLTPIALNATSVLNDLNGAAGPSFISPSLYADGATLGIVYQFLGGVFIQFDVEQVVATVDYTVDASSLTGDLVGASTDVNWVDTLGSPPVVNVVVVAGASIAPEFNNGSVTLNPVVDEPFIRGDCNQDGLVNIADGISIIQVLFNGATAADCAVACDANSDAAFDQSDAVFILNYRFSGGPAPAAPFPACDTESGADCDSHAAC